MAVIRANEEIFETIYMLTIDGKFDGKSGQFYMIKPTEGYEPFLLRPISIHDKGEDYISFLYQVKGNGTKILSLLKKGDTLNLIGPLGNGFMLINKDTTLIGGGVGVAPLYFFSKNFKENYPDKKLTVNLGFASKPYLIEKFEEFADELNINVGGKVTDDVDFNRDNIYISCGPEIMMKTAYEKAKEKTFYVSLEKRMACGIGACLGCSIKTANGMKKVCKDGPVFKAGEVFYE